MPQYDVLVIGAGPGGYVAAIRAAQLGLRTAIVERRHLGGICLNWGCIPTKSLLHSASLLHDHSVSAQFGVTSHETAASLASMVERSRSVAGQLNGGVQFLLRKNKVDTIWGEAELTAPAHIRVRPVEGVAPKGALPPGDYQASHVIVATGARERILPGLEPDGNRIWSYHHAMTPHETPKSLVIMGAGAIGIEFACFYAAIGTRVTIVESMPRILPQEDAEIADLMGKSLKKRGIAIVCGARISSARPSASGLALSLVHDDGQTTQIEAERLLSAAGVIANTQGLGLERLGIEMSGGVVKTGPAGQTSVPGIHAIGDVTGAPMLAHKAEHQGVLCAEAIAGKRPHAAVGPVPSCVYAHPQIASIGLSEAAALASGMTIEVGRFSFRGNGKAVTIAETEGMVKVLFDAATGRLAGAHMIGPAVSELVGFFALAMTVGATRSQILSTILPHPTLSEALYEAVLASENRALHA